MTRSVVGTAVAGVFFLATISTAFGQAQDGDQQKCINGINKAGAAVAKAQGKEHYGCLRAAGKNDLEGMTAQDCLTADVKGKVQKKRDKTGEVGTEDCIGAGDPDFGFTGAGNTNFSAETAELQLLSDIFGANLDAAVINCDTDDASKAACGCQQKVLKATDALFSKKAAEFLKCKKEVLKDGATSDAALAQCVEDPGTELSIAADTKGRIAKGIAGLDKAITKGCVEESVPSTGVFPNECDNLTGVPLRDCLDVLVECRVCQMINDIDGIWVDCDTFDNGVADASCASGTGPVPTPTPPFMSGDTFIEALPKSNGVFVYAGIDGLPGADSLCNTNFPGTHHCDYSELLVAEAAGELVGAQDINSNLVTSFWMIDTTEPNTTQCFDGGIRWSYGTAHTGVGGRFVTLNNGTGDLGAPSTNALPPAMPHMLICGAQQHWVGCCQ